MAAKLTLFLSLTFFLLLLLLITPLPSHAETHKSKNPSISLKSLQGARKGTKLKGLIQLKEYLHKFGYLASLTGDDFDDTLEVALKTYQQKFRLKPSGTLDAETISLMLTPRCGMPDIINGSSTHVHNHNHKHNSTSITFVASLFAIQGYKWSVMPVTYRFVTTMDSATQNAIRQAMPIWSAATNGRLTFQEVTSNEFISIGFYNGDHGDGYPFDGPSSTGGRVLAHAFFPNYGGDLHFDGTENWSSTAAVPSGAVDIQSIAIHELGHSLGLLHSDAPGAIMGPYYYGGKAITLTNDDIQAMRYLYGS